MTVDNQSTQPVTMSGPIACWRDFWALWHATWGKVKVGMQVDEYWRYIKPNLGRLQNYLHEQTDGQPEQCDARYCVKPKGHGGDHWHWQGFSAPEGTHESEDTGARVDGGSTNKPESPSLSGFTEQINDGHPPLEGTYTRDVEQPSPPRTVEQIRADLRAEGYSPEDKLVEELVRAVFREQVGADSLQLIRSEFAGIVTDMREELSSTQVGLEAEIQELQIKYRAVVEAVASMDTLATGRWTDLDARVLNCQQEIRQIKDYAEGGDVMTTVTREQFDEQQDLIIEELLSGKFDGPIPKETVESIMSVVEIINRRLFGERPQ